MEFIIRKRAEMAAYLEDTSAIIFRCRGEQVSEEKIRRWSERKDDLRAVSLQDIENTRGKLYFNVCMIELTTHI